MEFLPEVITVYNTAVPEPIAIFGNATVLAKYLSKGNIGRIRATIYNALNRRQPIKPSTTRLELSLAIRKATPSQIALLDGAVYKLLVDYIPPVPPNMLLGFHDTAESFTKQLVDHNNIGSIIAQRKQK